jgi:phospholipid/cholesterol/gamma-HCH transport system substrate-binding protein
VGLFVLVFTVALLGFGFWLAKYGFEQKYTYYYLYFSEPVDGLTMDSSVKLKGVDVGKVSKIEVLPDDVEHIRVLIRLKEGTPVTEGMYAVLKLQGITGLSYVEIEGGKRGAKMLVNDGKEYPAIPTRPSLSYRLTQQAPALLSKMGEAVDRLNKILSERNRKQIDTILDNTARATERAIAVEDRIIALATDFNTTLQHFDQRADALEKEIAGVTGVLHDQLPPVMESIRSAGENIATVAKGIDTRLRRGEYDLRRIVRPIKVDLSELSYRYQELAEELKSLSQHPSSLLFGGAQPPKGPGE